jgi:hypothetical protein
MNRTIRPIALSLLLAGATVAVILSLPAAAQTMQTRDVMRQKLSESALLLAALVTSDWGALDRHGRALDAVTALPGWDVMRLPEFYRYTTDFQRAVRAVIEAAEERDQRTALTAYNGLVASCVECHRYVSRARIARDSPPEVLTMR